VEAREPATYPSVERNPMSTPIEKLQEEFNTAMSVHEEQHIRYLDCQQRGDLSGEQRRLNAMKESGIRAIDTITQIKTSFPNSTGTTHSALAPSNTLHLAQGRHAIERESPSQSFNSALKLSTFLCIASRTFCFQSVYRPSNLSAASIRFM
jgi:hypothetical protein